MTNDAKSRMVDKKPPKGPSMTKKKAQDTSSGGDKVEDKLLNMYSGRDPTSLPTTLMLDHVSPATRLLEKRRQMFEVQEALNSQKDEFNRREDAYRRREDGLRRKDLELQESLIKFNKFLQENESKRKRAERRVAEEKKQQELKDIEIRELEAQLKEKLIEEGKLKDEVEKNLQYQDYLENICQNMSKYFPEISDILTRYNTLSDANIQLLAQKEADDEEMDAKAKEYSVFKKDKETQILNQNNEIAELQMQLEKKSEETKEIQARIDRERTEKSEKTLTLGSVISSVANILDRCEENFRRRQNKPQREKSVERPEKTNLQEKVNKTLFKLEECAMFIVDFLEIVKDFDTNIKGVGDSLYNEGLMGGSKSIVSQDLTQASIRA